MSHTPGPWEIFRVPNRVGPLIQTMNRGPIALLDGRHNAEENARLIAAAPELLAALHEIMDKWEMGNDMNDIQFVKYRATLAKAEGK